MTRRYPLSIPAGLVIAVLFGVLSTFADTNTMHPRFSLLDEAGQKVLDEKGKVSPGKTCGQCHDTEYIDNHNLHFGKAVKVGCFVCHFRGGRLTGNYAEAFQLIQQPDDRNCGQCHGLVHTEPVPLFIPDDYAVFPNFWQPYSLTQNTGVIMSFANLSDSLLNLKNKQALAFPWDDHARRQLHCTSCHFTRNNLRYCGVIRSPLGHLIRDPRRIEPVHEYLKRPDHNLETAACTCCHNPLAVHPDLPYKQRHIDVLSCQACHVPVLYGPALRTVDETVVDATGKARIEFRGTDEKQGHGTSLNTMYSTGYHPFLFAHIDKNNQHKISPFNLVTRWFWQSAQMGEPVPVNVLREVYLDGPAFRPEVVKVFDRDGSGRIEPGELILDSADKIDLIKEKLAAAGIKDPVIQGTIKAYKVNHGVFNSKTMKRDCASCHSSGSQLGQDVVLAGKAPAAADPQFVKGDKLTVNGEVITGANGELVLKRTSAIAGRYLFGFGRVRFLDHLGFWIFLICLFLALLHGFFRFIAARKRPVPVKKTQEVYMYGFYERLWHWTQAGGVLVLALTGIQIHQAGGFGLFSLQAAVRIHNIIAAILVLNAGLSLFYHLASGEIKQFFGFNRRFFKGAFVQAHYYISGIFRQESHPLEKTREKKLNPLQQLTYVILLNLLLPVQIITGILIWGTEKWPALSDKLGGLALLAPIHNLGSWLLLSFLVVHIYLTTTGHTVFSSLKAMITGYEETAPGKPGPDQEKLLDMKWLDLVGTLIKKAAK